MRMKNLLGLLAIGGAVVYAQKKRGGDLSIAGFKNSLRDIVGNMRGQLGNVTGNQNQQRGRQQHVGTGDDLGRVGSVGSSTSGVGGDIGREHIAGVGSTGGTQSGLGGDDFSSGSAGSAGSAGSGYGSNDINRKY